MAHERGGGGRPGTRSHGGAGHRSRVGHDGIVIGSPGVSSGPPRLGPLRCSGLPTRRPGAVRGSAHSGLRTVDEPWLPRLGRFSRLGRFARRPVRDRENIFFPSWSDPEPGTDRWERRHVHRRRPCERGRQRPVGIGFVARHDASSHRTRRDDLIDKRGATPRSHDDRSRAAEAAAHDDHQATRHDLGRDEHTVTALRVEFNAIGTTACVVAERPADLIAARRALEVEIERIDLACSRFRPDSDLAGVHRSAGAPVRIGGALVEALQVAMHAAEVTSGLVDPTVGANVIALGYDRDFAAVQQRVDTAIPGAGAARPLPPPPGWRAIELDVDTRTVRVPRGAVLDLGATAKALAVDRAARTAQQVCVGSVVVGIGGDIAVAGRPPDGGWSIRIADRHRGGEPAPAADSGQTSSGTACVALRDGALATSSTAFRRWRFGGRECHHIVDPRTGLPTANRWCTVSVAGATCVDANTASTAAIVLGDDAPSWLASRRLPSRLVAVDGTITHVAGWPADAEARVAA